MQVVNKPGAHFSMRYMENRRVEEMERKGMPDPEIVTKLQQRAEEELKILSEMAAEEKRLKQMKLEAQQALDAQAFKEGQERLGRDQGAEVPMRQEDADAVTDRDIEMARASL